MATALCKSAVKTIIGGHCRLPKKKQARAQRWIGKSAALLLAVWAAFVSTHASGGNGFYVTSAADSGPGSLRAAIDGASNYPGGGLIFFDLPCSGANPPTIMLLSPLPTVDSYFVQFNGNNNQFGQHPDCPGPVIIDGSMLPSGSYALRFKHPGPFSEVRGLKIQNVPGEAITDDGGNLVGGGPLLITGCTITHNQVGIFLNAAKGDVIGVVAPGDSTLFAPPPAGPTNGGNVISGNSFAQVYINGGSENIVQGNLIGTDVTGTAADPLSNQGVYIVDSSKNVIGGWKAGQGNLIAGCNSSAASFGLFIVSTDGTLGGNTVVGNQIGINDDGDGMPIVIPDHTGVAVLNSPNNILLSNLISGNAASGVLVQGSTATGNQLLGNHIGTDATGLLKLGNGNLNVGVLSAPGNTIGRTTPGFGNSIVDARGGSAGIQINSANNTTILDNSIGTDATGLLNLGNSGQGIQIFASSNMNIAGNLIAFNGAGGITLVDFGQPYPVNDAFRSNSIFSNSGFSGGIDLKGDGPTADDAGDPDDGPNHLQNFPVISSAVTANGITTISGTLNSAASTAFAIDLFASVVSTASNREGQFFLGSVPATTDVAGDASFNLGVSQPAPVPAGYLITVTATDPQGNTSEFAFPVAVTGTAAAQDIALSTSTASTGTPGATLSYIFPLKNLSASASGPLTFSDPLPAGLTFVNVTSSAGTAGNSGNNVTVTFSSLAANATASITVNATIDAGAPIDSYLVNRATVSTDRPDPNPFNNSAAVATLVQPILIITSMAHLPNGHIQLQGKGAPMRTHTIEASPDLSSGSFFALGTAMSDANGLLQFDDAGAAGESKQFYRLTFPDPFQPKAATTTRQVVGRTAGKNRAGLTRSPELVAPPGILNRQ